jgi:Zn-dependent peptidase ImmA (M78 family)
MARQRSGKWTNRLNLGQIEDLAVQKVAEFRRTLLAAGLNVPEIPPLAADYLALTITELSVRSVVKLSYANKRLSGMLDMERAEIVYEEHDPPGRQNFTIAHELGHYFLHYLPAVEMARQPSLFDAPHFDFGLDEKLTRPSAQRPARFYRCSETVITTTEDEAETPAPPTEPAKIGRRELEDPSTQAHLAKIIRLHELETRIEWEASIFARGLLMPSDLVRWLNKKYSGDVTAMSAELGVTPTALRYRLNGLRLRQDDDKGLGSSYKLTPKPSKSHQQGSLF